MCSVEYETVVQYMHVTKSFILIFTYTYAYYLYDLLYLAMEILQLLSTCLKESTNTNSMLMASGYITLMR